MSLPSLDEPTNTDGRVVSMAMSPLAMRASGERLVEAPLPVVRQQFAQRTALILADEHDRLGIRLVDLVDELAAASARRNDRAVRGRGGDLRDARLAVTDHFRDRAVLGAKTDAAKKVEIDAGEDIAAIGDQRRADVSHELPAFACRCRFACAHGALNRALDELRVADAHVVLRCRTNR